MTLAADGQAQAVAEIVRALERPIYGIALRMLFDRQDAEDATQEALVRIVTRLAQFSGDSAFDLGVSDRGPADPRFSRTARRRRAAHVRSVRGGLTATL